MHASRPPFTYDKLVGNKDSELMMGGARGEYAARELLKRIDQSEMYRKMNIRPLSGMDPTSLLRDHNAVQNTNIVHNFKF